MNNIEIANVAALLKPVSNEVLNGKGKLCLSITYLDKLNRALDENTTSEDYNTSFQILSASSTKTNLIRDVQFLYDLVNRTHSLKIIPDVQNDCSTVDINKFKDIKILDVQKVDIETIRGLQKLRSHLQEISFSHSLSSLNDVLLKCGGDDSQPYIWSELKKASFPHNNISELEDCFEYTAWLHTLDLSYNEIQSVDSLNCLHNLKHLNLSYNKLDCVPHFKGQLCNRLQILILKNNFIEDITGITFLVNLVQLDLSQNCVLDHKSLMTISNLVSLQWINLLGNPLSYHPHHRNQTCNYLNRNTASIRFVLDNEPLSKFEKSLVGSLHPIMQVSLTSSTNSLTEYSPSVASERPRRVRNVTIEDESVVKEEQQPVVLTPSGSSQHLEIKKQVEQLREEFGESWLNRHSGQRVQDVLGIESSIERPSMLFSSTPYGTPYETAFDSSELNDSKSEVTSDNVQFETATAEEPTVFDCTTGATEDDESQSSDGEELMAGEESIYLALVQGEVDQVFVVITQTHISERECTTSKERAKWHASTLINCETMNENSNSVKLEFDTVRRDRKQRIYVFEDDGEAECFFESIKNSMEHVKPTKQKLYQCMKCLEVFAENRNSRDKGETLTCPKCESNMVVEEV